MTSLMATAFWPLTNSTTWGISKTEQWKEMGFGKMIKERSMWGSGRTTKQTDMAYTSQRKVTIKVIMHQYRLFQPICQARLRHLIIHKWRLVSRLLLKRKAARQGRIHLGQWGALQRTFQPRNERRIGIMDQLKRWLIQRKLQFWSQKRIWRVQMG